MGSKYRGSARLIKVQTREGFDLRMMVPVFASAWDYRNDPINGWIYWEREATRRQVYSPCVGSRRWALGTITIVAAYHRIGA